MKKNNKKGLAGGLLAMMIVLFLFAIFSLAGLYMWQQFDNGIQSMDNTTITPDVKAQVSGLGSMVNWADKIFTILFIALLVAYIISAVTIPVEEPIYFLIFTGFLIIFTILAMVLSNAWVYITQISEFSDVVASLSFTDFFMRYFPFIVFIVGIVGAVIFYGRKYIGPTNFNSGGGNGSGFE